MLYVNGESRGRCTSFDNVKNSQIRSSSDFVGSFSCVHIIYTSDGVSGVHGLASSSPYLPSRSSLKKVTRTRTYIHEEFSVCVYVQVCSCVKQTKEQRVRRILIK